MRLKSGLTIKNPRKMIRAFVKHWYEMYDGVSVEHDNQLRIPDIALSTMLMSRISGMTGGEIWRNRKQVEDALAEIPSDIDPLNVSANEEIPGASGISRAITAMCEIHRVKLAVSTKILHKKRPALIPIFDSVVESQYYPLHCPSVPGRSSGDYAMALTRCVHRDMLGAAGELRDLSDELASESRPMTPLRILNAMTWVVKAGNEEWLYDQVRDVE
jgi:uncharacterized protein DUF6308